MQAIHPQTDAGQTKKAIYNLFAAYVHTVPLEQLIENVERGSDCESDKEATVVIRARHLPGSTNKQIRKRQ